MQAETILIGEGILLIFLVVLSALFSGSETALFSLSRARLQEYKDSPNPSARAAFRLMESYHHTLIILIMGNMFVNVGISMISDNLIHHLALNPVTTSIISIIFSVVVLLIFGEVSPKTLALLNSVAVSLKVSRPLLFIYTLLRPFILLLNKIFSVILDILGRRKSEPLSAEEYSTYLDVAHLGGAFNAEEKDLLESALLMSRKEILDVMTGRVDVVSVHKTDSEEKISKIILREKEHFYPVISNDIDDADFLLSTKRFFLLPREERANWYRSSAMIPAQFVPENAGVSQALENMNRAGVAAALVTDEYGRVSGLVTKEDIFAEMIGDIEDEYDEPDYTFEQREDGSWSFTGMIPLYLFEELTGWDIPQEDDLDSSTLNGLFSEKLGRLPLNGDEILMDRIKLRADRISKHRAIAIHAWLLDEPEQHKDEAADKAAETEDKS